MKVSEARRMIGQAIRFRKRYSGITETGIIMSVRGKNIEVDVMGIRDWLWLPDLVISPALSSHDNLSPTTTETPDAQP